MSIGGKNLNWIRQSRILSQYKKIWMGFAIVLGNIVSGVVLFLFFYGVITPIGLLCRLFGKTFVQRKPTDSYWISRTDYSSEPERYEKQF